MHRVFLFFFFCANVIVVERKGNLLYSKTNLFVKFAMKKEENRGEENKGFNAGTGEFQDFIPIFIGLIEKDQ